MQRTTTYSRGDVVLVNFLFSEGAGAKRRPAVLVSSQAYQSGRREVIAAAVTSNTDRILDGDSLLNHWQAAGLLFPSVATGVIRTIKQGMITRTLGSLSHRDMDAIDQRLRLILDLED
jgi:mRNA interferase MazF